MVTEAREPAEVRHGWALKLIRRLLPLQAKPGRYSIVFTVPEDGKQFDCSVTFLGKVEHLG